MSINWVQRACEVYLVQIVLAVFISAFNDTALTRIIFFTYTFYHHFALLSFPVSRFLACISYFHYPFFTSFSFPVSLHILSLFFHTSHLNINLSHHSTFKLSYLRIFFYLFLHSPTTSTSYTFALHLCPFIPHPFLFLTPLCPLSQNFSFFVIVFLPISSFVLLYRFSAFSCPPSASIYF